MKKLLIAFFLIGTLGVKAQKVDKIYVNLYTDSLKKGTHNYINVDGEFNNGKYLPLDSTKIQFSCPQAKFFGNNLYIPADFSGEKVLVIVNLRNSIINYSLPPIFINSTWMDVLNAGTINLNTQISLQPYSYIILKQ